VHHANDHLEVTAGSPATASATSRTMAVMVTDVAGSTRLRAAVGDDEATHLIVILSRLVDNAVTAHQGTVRRGTGDGDRSTFTSVRAALRAAAAIQGLLARRPLVARDGQAVQLRIGICVGEVDVNTAGNISGPPVRAADRMTSESPVGGIALCPIAATMSDEVATLELVEATDRAILLQPRIATVGRTLPGRGEAMAALHGALDRLAQRHGGMVVVSGEVGSGRSQLLDETARAATELGLRTLRHRCVAGAEDPNATLVALLDDALRHVDEDTIRDAVGSDGSVLAAILPELAAVLPDVELGQEAPGQPRIERALSRFLSRAAATRPLLLVVDDLDLADDPSRDVICRLAPKLGELGVLLVASMHDHSTASSSATWRALAGLVRAGHAEPVKLDPLLREAIRELLADALIEPPTTIQVHKVAERTGGNVALVAALAREASRLGTDVGTVAMPGSAAIPLRETVGLLGATGRQVLELLAILGKPTTLALLIALIDEPEEQILSAIEHAEQLAILDVEDLAGQMSLWFRQGLVRELILEETGGITQTRWSQRAGSPQRDIA